MAARGSTAFSCLIGGVEDGCCGRVWAGLSSGVPGLPEPSREAGAEAPVPLGGRTPQPSSLTGLTGMRLRVYVKGTELEHEVKGRVSMRKSREEGRAAAAGPQGERATDWATWPRPYHKHRPQGWPNPRETKPK